LPGPPLLQRRNEYLKFLTGRSLSRVSDFVLWQVNRVFEWCRASWLRVFKIGVSSDGVGRFLECRENIIKWHHKCFPLVSRLKVCKVSRKIDGAYNESQPYTGSSIGCLWWMTIDLYLSSTVPKVGLA